MRFRAKIAKINSAKICSAKISALKVDKSKSSRLHPQGDGTAEASVKQLKLCIQKQVQLNGTDWDLNLQSAAFAIRSSTANSTQVTPAELVLGTKLIQPIDKVLPTQSQDVQPLPHNQRQASQFAKSLVNKLNETISITQNNLLKSRARMKHSFDKHTTPIPINVGDHVMLWTPYKKQNLSRCFQPNWSGPWIVQQYTGPTNCKLINDKGHIKNVLVNQLKRIEERHTVYIYQIQIINKQHIMSMITFHNLDHRVQRYLIYLMKMTLKLFGMSPPNKQNIT